MRIRQLRARWCSRKTAKEIKEKLQCESAPDRMALKKEADEYAAYLRSKRASHN